MAYTAGRGWVEALRGDHANHIVGHRLNDWTSILVFTAGLVVLLRVTRPARPSVRNLSRPGPAGVTDPTRGTFGPDGPVASFIPSEA